MSVATPHPAYLARLDIWNSLSDAYVGSSAVKGARMVPRGTRGLAFPGTRYLPRPSGHRLDAQYLMYLTRASWGGYTETVVNGIGGAVFRKAPVLEAPAVLTPQLEDVTQTGVPLRTFAEQALQQTLLLGRFGVLVDFPQPVPVGGPLPVAAPRPYWIPYQAQEILNWRTIQRQGDTILSLVVLQESVEVPRAPWPSPDYFVITTVPQYRVLRLDEAGRYEVSVWRDPAGPRQGRGVPLLLESWVPLRLGQPLDFIPFLFMAPFSLESGIQKSLLEPLVEVNYRYYRHTADYEQALHLNALPTPVVCSDSPKPTEPLIIGGSEAWWIVGASSKFGMLELNPAGLPALQIALDTDKRDMAALGARLLEGPPQQAETATANTNRLAGTESPMQSLITTVSQGLTQALQIHAFWDGVTDDPDDTAIHLSLNSDLVPRQMAPQMLQALVQALLQHTISFETFYFNLQQGEVARPLIPVEDEQELITMAKEQDPLLTLPPPAQAPVPAVRNGTARPVG